MLDSIRLPPRTGTVCNAERLHQLEWWERDPQEGEDPEDRKNMSIFRRIRAQFQSVAGFIQVAVSLELLCWNLGEEPGCKTCTVYHRRNTGPSTRRGTT